MPELPQAQPFPTSGGYRGPDAREQMRSGLLTVAICGCAGLVLLQSFGQVQPVIRERAKPLVMDLLPVPLQHRASTGRPASAKPQRVIRSVIEPVRVLHAEQVSEQALLVVQPRLPPVIAIPLRASALPVPPAPEAERSPTVETKPDGWEAQLSRQLVSARLYPAPLRARRVEGQVELSLTVDRSGDLAELHIAQSSGNPALDRAALATAQRAAPFSPVPADLDAPRTIIVPIRFTLR